ncbi:FMN-dependent NADH-azoreductase [Acrocarpospora corrugata]|uniref:FMN dependent NADH:quinone oxidoreductase n=1 Tax=Acrocarpospora corrugata TaxID=35763 RepID=A0A5M3W9B0_9ACTN|nr:NAD(P)H-dependent oxidoreductase [Acrocarpospora corrugata]GES05657.1 FMN-dependent NADH-azoreductase [Acrocarpospora corrugata]
MSRLLHISASPRGSASLSRGIAEAFLAEYRDGHPGGEVDHFDLWDGTLPEFGPAAAGAKMTVMTGGELAGEQKSAWEDAVATFRRFDAYDKYLFSVPMWNGGVPYILKQFIDVVSQPGLVFGIDGERGYLPLLSGKRAAVVYTSAVWAPGLGAEWGENAQSPFFEGWLRWAGIDDIQGIRFHPALWGDYPVELKKAEEAAREVAKTF